MNENYLDNEDWGNDLDDWDGVDYSNLMSGPDDWEIEKKQASDAEDWSIKIAEAEDYSNDQNDISEVSVPEKIIAPRTKSKSFKHKKSSKIKSDLIFLSFKSASEYAKNSARDKQRTFNLKRVGLVRFNRRVESCWKVSLAI